MEMRAFPSAVRAYGVALVASATALALALALAPVTGGRGGSFFVVAVALVAGAYGWGPGLVVAALGFAAIDWFFESPPGSLAVDNPNTLLSVLSLVVVAAVVGLVSARRRAALEASEAARAELEAVLDGVDDSVIVYAPDRRIVRVNRAARERLLAGWGKVPRTVDEMRATVRPTDHTGALVERMPSEEALAGRSASTTLVYEDPTGRVRRFSVRAAPVRDQAGQVRGAVTVWHDATDLYEAANALGQLDGAFKTARRVTHELGNALVPARGYSELLQLAAPEEAAAYVGEITASIDRAARILDQIGRIVRFEQVEFGGEVMLDLEAAASPGEVGVPPS